MIDDCIVVYRVWFGLVGVFASGGLQFSAGYPFSGYYIWFFFFLLGSLQNNEFCFVVTRNAANG